MSDVPEIKELSKVIEPFLDGGKLISYESRYLTKPGENYGSVMLAVAAKIRLPNGVVEELPLVAKLPPITNDLYWQIFQPQRTCITENAIYMNLATELRQLQLEAGIAETQLFEAFPKYYGSRISLDPTSTQVDRDAVLLQENLQTAGFRAGDRLKMYDFNHARLILEQVALYHALPIVLRLKKPERFNQLVRPFVHRFNMNDGMATEVKEQMFGEMLKEVEYATNNNDEMVELIKQFITQYDEFLALPDASDGLYTSVVHCDLWINNIMLHYDENGTPDKVKIVDFQVAQYESVLHDVVFFLFSSVETKVLENRYNDLLEIYFTAFLNCLKRFDICTKDYTFEGFLKEVQRVGSIELTHVLIMTKIILADNSKMPENFKDMDMSVLSKLQGQETIVKRVAEFLQLAQKYKFIE